MTKPINGNERRLTQSLSLPPKIRKWLDELCERNGGISRTEMVRQMVIRAHEEMVLKEAK